jgi:membrane dipeptidase
MTTMQLAYTDHHQDPGAWAKKLDISDEAIAIYLDSDVVDLHIDTFIWTRQLGYDLTKRHGLGVLRGRLGYQVDLPRIREAHVTGAMWSITTNPLPTAARRERAFFKNLPRLQAILRSCHKDVALCKTHADYVAARAASKHAAFIGIQGGNALDAPGAVDKLPDDILRVTLVHLGNSSLGVTSAPLAGNRKGQGLTDFGKEYVHTLNAKKIFVDLAHINREGFFDAVSVHDKSQPLIVTHTGVIGVHPHWRNLEDEQLRAIADTGGTIGVMYQSTFLGDKRNAGRAESIVRHLEHITSVVGEDYCSLGSDFDGWIVPPRDMPTCLELPRLVQIMLNRKWTPARIQKALGKNFLRALALLRSR